MKVPQQRPVQTPAPAPAPATPAAGGRRWLAQLEQALMADRQTDAGRPQRQSADRRATDSDGHHGDASGHGDQGPASDAPRAAAHHASAAPAATPASSSSSSAAALHGDALSALAWSNASAGSGGAWAVAAWSAAAAEAEAAQPVAAAGNAPVDAARPLRTAAQATPFSAGDRALAPPPRYARQFMQVTLADDTAQASVRDASLGPDGALAVAQSVTAQLRSDGIDVQRVFVNGRRFDAATASQAPAVSAAAPDPLPSSTSQQQE